MKINFTQQFFPIWKEYKKILTIMKLCGILLFIASFNVVAAGYSQTVSVSMNNVSMREVFKEIENQSELSFLFSDDMADLNGKVSVNARNKKVVDVLEDMLRNTDLGFRILDEKLIVVAPKSVMQQKNVTGKVLDTSGEPLPGVSVVVKGTQTGTVTDIDGGYAVTVPDNSAVLIFSYVGFTPQEITVGNRTIIPITMGEDVTLIDEVVVVGYGTQKKVSLTGSIASINSDEIVTTKNENVKNMLTGKIPGLRVTQTTSEPGSFKSSFDIRGFGNPLVIIDGVPRDNIDRIDGNDIESLVVLKDASAAVYGVRAANGVVLIETKKGKKDTFSLDYTGTYGLQYPSGFPEPASPAEYMMLRNEQSMHNMNNPRRVYSDEQINEYMNGTKQGYSWYDGIIKSPYPQTQQNLSITGGSDKITYYSSLGYSYQDGFLKSNDLNYSRYNIRSNVSGKFHKRFTVDVNLSGIMDTKNQPWENPDWIIRNFWRQNPLQSPYANDNPDYYLYTWIEGVNPLAQSEKDMVGYKQYNNKMFQSSVSFKWDVPYIDGLQFRGMGSYDYSNRDNTLYQKAYSLYEYDASTDVYTEHKRNSPSYIRREYFAFTNLLTQLALDYKRTFNNAHSVNALAVFEQSERKADNIYARRDLAIPLDKLIAGGETNQQGYMATGSDDFYDYTNMAFVGRLNYDYLSKYLVEFNFRYEGSSKFPSNSRWAFFPSIQGGWRISEEKFIKNWEPLSFLSNLKLRASYGILGDDGALAYQFISGYNYPPSGEMANNNRRTAGYVFDNNFVTAVESKGIPNPDITWSESKTLDLGVDFEFWNGLLGGTFDYFKRDRTGLLGNRAQAMPGIVGANLPQENLNGDRTWGYELELTHRNRIGDVNYYLKGIFSFTRTMYTTREKNKEGNSYQRWRETTNTDRYNGVWRGYGADGRYTSWSDIYNSPVFVGKGTLPGDYIYEDWNGDGIISELDEYMIGYSDSGEDGKPLINYGLTIGGDYKGFDLNMLWQGAAMRNIKIGEQLRIPLWGNENSSALEQFMDRWHPIDPDANPYDPNTEWVSGHFAYTGTHPDENSEFNMEDAKYIRLKSIEIGYTIPQQYLKKINGKSIRVFLNGYNLVTFTPVKYVDPEHPSAGYGYWYPLNKTVSIGLNVKF